MKEIYSEQKEMGFYIVLMIFVVVSVLLSASV